MSSRIGSIYIFAFWNYKLLGKINGLDAHTTSSLTLPFTPPHSARVHMLQYSGVRSAARLTLPPQPPPIRPGGGGHHIRRNEVTS
ncbi:hypothetical protein DH2020_046396 [Rehmannia glutinosa]|uniref:Uncharacterized protein n=1 Tax=Rehmannia glutinosa TaxID=99300 RepID=A0ABR0UBX7_REHGL